MGFLENEKSKHQWLWKHYNNFNNCDWTLIVTMKKIRILLVKSVIDRSETTKRTVAALGLKKLNASVEVEVTPQILGMVRRVQHLLKVQEIPSKEVVLNDVIA